MSVIDAHLHVFRRYSEDYPRPIHAGLAEADREVLAEDLIKEMDKAGVEKAIVVPLGPEDHYVAEIQREYPGKFAAVGIFDATAKDQEENLDSVLLRAGFREFGWDLLIKERILERTQGLLRCSRSLRQWLSEN